MLLTNQRLDKLASARTHLASRGLLQGTVLSETINNIVDPSAPESDDDVEEADSEGWNASETVTEVIHVGEDDDNDGEPVDDRTTAVGVHLARTRGTLGFYFIFACIYF